MGENRLDTETFHRIGGLFASRGWLSYEPETLHATSLGLISSPRSRNRREATEHTFDIGANGGITVPRIANIEGEPRGIVPNTDVGAVKLDFYPLTPERWGDFEALFGKHGAYSGCWCMWWRLTRAQFTAQQGEGNRQALKALVDAGEVPGLLACDGDRAVGWCSLGPREVFGSLERSRALKRPDDEPVWAVVCFYLARPYRRRGLLKVLLRGAVDYAASRGARIVEGYPVEPRKPTMPDMYAYTGLMATFIDVGFKEVARGATGRPIMRFCIE